MRYATFWSATCLSICAIPLAIADEKPRIGAILDESPYQSTPLLDEQPPTLPQEAGLYISKSTLTPTITGQKKQSHTSIKAPSPGSGDCFTRQSNQKLAFDFVNQAPPPMFSTHLGDYPERHDFYPATAYASGNVARLADESPNSPSGFTFSKYYFLWGNRCVYMKGITPNLDQCRNTHKPKGNYYMNMITDAGSGIQIRPAFSTYAKADQCTLIQTAYVLGQHFEGLKTKASQAGLTVLNNPDRATLATYAKEATLADGAKRKYLIDTCMLDSSPAAKDIKGIMIDWEVQDARMPAQTEDFFQRLTSLVKKTFSKQLMVFTNDLASGSRTVNGLASTNIEPIITMTDGFAPIVWSGATAGNPETELEPFARRWTFQQNLKTQLEIIGNGTMPKASLLQKLIPAISLYDLQLSEAESLNNTAQRLNLKGMLVWRNNVKQGGACTRPENQNIACLAFGACDGKYTSN